MKTTFSTFHVYNWQILGGQKERERERERERVASQMLILLKIKMQLRIEFDFVFDSVSNEFFHVSLISFSCSSEIGVPSRELRQSSNVEYSDLVMVR